VDAGTALVLVKLLHTVVWALLVACIAAIPAAALAGRLRLAAVLSAVMVLETAVLAANAMRCPITDLAMRYTADRGDAFDIYLPPWLARNNKRVFGTLWIAGEVVLVGCWYARRRRAPRPVLP